MVLKYELKAGLARYLTESGAPVTSLAGLIEFNREHAEREMPFFGQDIFEQAQALGPLTEAAYLDARETTRRLAGPEGIAAALAEQQLDALGGPAHATPWLHDPNNTTEEPREG